jgi:nucleotide-binding universal stress UspA family protein
VPRVWYLVGVDFSAESQRALEAARRLARRSGASITIAHVRPLSDVRAAVVEERGELLREPARTLSREIAAHYARRLDAVARSREETLLLRGAAHFALAREANRGYDLLVVGRGGRGGVEGLFLGSTVTRTLSGSRVPVLVVPGKG